jgi:hypothetical protein
MYRLWRYRLFLFSCLNPNIFAVIASMENYFSSCLCEKGKILSTTDILARMEFIAVLAHDNFSGFD